MVASETEQLAVQPMAVTVALVAAQVVLVVEQVEQLLLVQVGLFMVLQAVLVLAVTQAEALDKQEQVLLKVEMVLLHFLLGVLQLEQVRMFQELFITQAVEKQMELTVVVVLVAVVLG